MSSSLAKVKIFDISKMKDENYLCSLIEKEVIPAAKDEGIELTTDDLLKVILSKENWISKN